MMMREHRAAWAEPRREELPRFQLVGKCTAVTLRIGNSMAYRRDTVGPRLCSDIGGARASTRNRMSVGREEIFGLVLVAQPFSKLERRSRWPATTDTAWVRVYSPGTATPRMRSAARWMGVPSGSTGKIGSMYDQPAVQDDRGPQMQRLHFDAFENRVGRW